MNKKGKYMDKEKFKESFGNPKLPKMTLEKFIKTERAIENFCK